MGARSVRKPGRVAVTSLNSDDVTTSVFEIRECGVDWLTCSAFRSREATALELLGQRLIAAEARSGVDVAPWRFEQFEGLNAGHVACGLGDGMVLLRLSSHLAYSHWTKAYALASSVSRIDYQVTIRGVTDGPTFIRSCHAQALDHVATWKRPPEVLMRDSNRTGPTLYLGTRKSPWFGRVYDKFVETKLDDYASCVRFEVQFQKHAARQAALELHRAKSESAAGAALVASLMEKRGVAQAWEHNANLQLCCPRPRGDADKRLRWLGSQVAPAIDSLVRANKLTEVLRVLRLDQLVQPIGPASCSLSTEEEE